MNQANFPSVSVIIPVFNAGKFIERTLAGVFSQTYTDFEVVVVDDGSSDNTAEIVKGYGQKINYIYQKNSGDGPARNTGINAARGQWLAFLDHDDEWMPEKLQRQMHLLKQNADLVWCATSFYTQIGDIRKVAAGYDRLDKTLNNQPYFENYFNAISKKQAAFLTSTMVIKKEVFEKAGFFEACWLRCADTDMWWRIAYLFPKIGFVPKPLTILHLDLQDAIGTRLRLQARHGEDDRKLIAKHLKLALEHNCTEAFVPCAKAIMRQTLLIALSYGFKKDARTIASQFRLLLGMHWLILTYILTIFPKITSVGAETLLRLIRKLGLQKDLSRRQITPKESERSM